MGLDDEAEAGLATSWGPPLESEGDLSEGRNGPSQALLDTDHERHGSTHFACQTASRLSVGDVLNR